MFKVTLESYEVERLIYVSLQAVHLMVPVHNSLSETLATRLFFRIQNFSGFGGGHTLYILYMT